MSSTSIYPSELSALIEQTIQNSKINFQPTYLYIKQHSVTGKLYFGKTSKSHDEMLNYTGSGVYWTDHINKHGKEHVETLWYCLFLDKETLVKFALSYCHFHNIGVGDTSIWANLQPENGIDGQLIGHCIKRRLTQNEFLVKANSKHNNMYEYSFAKYTKSISKIIITCKTHGNFSQTAQDHLAGAGCPKCANLKNSQHQIAPFSYFLSMAKQKHGNKFIYEEDTYIGMNKKMKIICPIHGEFLAYPSGHLFYDCWDCSQITKSNKLKGRIGGNKGKKKLTERLDKGSTKKIVTCPHCLTKGGGGVMQRFHFNRCKHKF